MERAVGRSVARKDGLGKATGKAVYADDLVFPGMLWGRTVRSEIPRGRVRAIRRNFDESDFTVVDFRDIPGKNVIALIELDQIMERQVAGAGVRGKAASLGGVKAAAQILNALDSTRELEVMETIVNADADLGQRIQEQMFVFDDLMRVDDRGMQTLLRDVPGDRLVIALKGADPAMREKIFSNMSKRAADMMREDLEVKGPVRLSEVDAAQKEILAAARTLAEQGQINLGGGGDEDV